MAVKKIIRNVFEDLSELGRSTAKQAARSVVDTLSPGALIEHVQQRTSDKQDTPEHTRPGANSTPLDLKKLDKAYGGDEEAKKVAARNQLFRFIQEEQMRRMQTGQQEAQVKANQEAATQRQATYDKQMQARAQAQPAQVAGKQKLRLGQARKKASVPETTEYKPGSGKQ